MSASEAPVEPRAAPRVLRDGTGVVFAPATPDDASELVALGVRAPDPRHEYLDALVERAGSVEAGDFALAARRGDDGTLVGFGGYVVVSDGRATIVCVVDSEHLGLGLGTSLLRELADRAVGEGISVFCIDLHPGSARTVEVLRDCGLRTLWDLTYPVARAKLRLDRRRSGWSTPDARA